MVGEGRAHCAVRSSLAADARAPTPTVSAALGTSTRAPGNLNRGTQRRGRAGASGLAAAVRRAPAAAGARREDTSHGVHVRSGAAAEPARAPRRAAPAGAAARAWLSATTPRRDLLPLPWPQAAGTPAGCAADSTRRSRPRCRGLGTAQQGRRQTAVWCARQPPHTGVLFETTPPARNGRDKQGPPRGFVPHRALTRTPHRPGDGAGRADTRGTQSAHGSVCVCVCAQSSSLADNPTLTRASPSPARKRAPRRVTTPQLNYSSIGTSEGYVSPRRPYPGGPPGRKINSLHEGGEEIRVPRSRRR